MLEAQYAEIREKIIEIVHNAIPLEVDEIPETATMQELGIQSIDALNVMEDLEHAFEIDLEDVTMEEANTLKGLVAVVARLRSGADDGDED